MYHDPELSGTIEGQWRCKGILGLLVGYGRSLGKGSVQVVE